MQRTLAIEGAKATKETVSQEKRSNGEERTAVRLAAVGGLPRCKGTTDTNRFNVTRAACIGGVLTSRLSACCARRPSNSLQRLRRQRPVNSVRLRFFVSPVKTVLSVSFVRSTSRSRYFTTLTSSVMPLLSVKRTTSGSSSTARPVPLPKRSDGKTRLPRSRSRASKALRSNGATLIA